MNRVDLENFLKRRDENMPIVFSCRGENLEYDPVVKKGDIVKADLIDEYRLEVKVVSVNKSSVFGTVLNDFFKECCLYGRIHLGEIVEIDMDYVIACSRNC